jgi:hypothetical protein
MANGALPLNLLAGISGRCPIVLFYKGASSSDALIELLGTIMNGALVDL